jgi:hypothetical protein
LNHLSIVARFLILYSNQHFYRYNAEDYNWIDDLMSQLRRDFLAERLKLLGRHVHKYKLRASRFIPEHYAGIQGTPASVLPLEFHSGIQYAGEPCR